MTAKCQCGAKIREFDRRYSGPCSVCGVATCPQHTLFYVDESNVAITRAARPVCLTCCDRTPEPVRSCT